jgi:hypothetical protein
VSREVVRVGVVIRAVHLPDKDEVAGSIPASPTGKMSIFPVRPTATAPLGSKYIPVE